METLRNVYLNGNNNLKPQDTEKDQRIKKNLLMSLLMRLEEKHYITLNETNPSGKHPEFTIMLNVEKTANS